MEPIYRLELSIIPLSRIKTLQISGWVVICSVAMIYKDQAYADVVYGKQG